jgi:hypothetical protein
MAVSARFRAPRSPRRPRVEADPAAGRDAQLAAGDAVGPAQRVDQLARDGGEVLGVVDAGQQQDELVAAEPRDGVALAHALAEPRGDATQQGVADGVAKAVVDLLEAVEVDEDEPDAVAVAVGLRERDLEAVLEEPPVREAR